MSMQQVNLYLPELRPRKMWLTANSIALSVVGFICLMTISVLVVKRGLVVYEARVVALETQARSAEQRVVSFRAKVRPVNSLQYDRKLAHLKQSVAAREQIGLIIQGQNLGNAVGFSEPMLSLARQSLDSVSLQHIRISRGGAFIELKGLTRSAQDVPRYVHKLQREDSLKGSQFGLLSLSHSAGRQDVHQFALGFDSVYQLAKERAR